MIVDKAIEEGSSEEPALKAVAAPDRCVMPFYPFACQRKPGTICANCEHEWAE